MKKEEVTQLVYLVLGFVEMILGLRVVLIFFRANPESLFTQWIHKIGKPLLIPFVNIFPATVVEKRYVLDVSTVFSMFIYAVVAVLTLYLIRTSGPKKKPWY